MRYFQKQPADVFFKKGVFKNSTEIHLCWTLFLIKLQAFRPETTLKRDSSTSVFQRTLRNFKERLF